jgi:hypothetical protein
MLRVYVGVRYKFKRSKSAQVFGDFPMCQSLSLPLQSHDRTQAELKAIEMHNTFKKVGESKESLSKYDSQWMLPI